MFIFMQNLKRSKKGFTLIEMLVVIAIIAILVAIIIPVVGTSTAKAAAATNAANLRAVESQLTIMRLTNPQQFETWANTWRDITGNEVADVLQGLLNIFGGLGDKIDKNLRTTTAQNGVLTFPMDPGSINVPTAAGLKITIDGTTYQVAKGTEMSVYINGDELECSYGNYTKDHFAAIAGGGAPGENPDGGSGGIIDGIGDIITDIITGEGCG